MEILLIVLLLLATIGISNIVNHFTPYIPAPLIQILLGVIIAAVPVGNDIPMGHELFFVLFIAPLLFNDGRNTSREALWKLRQPILLLALGLVFVTVFVIGYLIHWLIPSIPLPAAFALAAILSPTDVVAVGAISSRVNIPKPILHLLEGEGLMNDASGLVAFKFAVAATVTGVFSLAAASWSFLVISIGGIVSGIVLAFIIIRLRVLIRRLGMEDVTIHMLIQILTPFVIYLATEHFHLSGILAVVAAGIVHAIERDRETSPNIQLQIVSRSTWIVILHILNGLVFVLLGLQIPSVVRESIEGPQFNTAEMLSHILIISAALFLLRFIWVYLSWWSGWKLRSYHAAKPSLNKIGVITVSGVRGAITLAGAFSIPVVLADGSPFPERALITFIAAGVILVTLVAASIILPLIAKPEEQSGDTKEEMERAALIQIKQTAIREIREMTNEENREAASAVLSAYHHNLNQLLNDAGGTGLLSLKQEEIAIRMKAFEAESQYIANRMKEKHIDQETAYSAQAFIRRKELAVTNRLKFRGLVLWTLLKKVTIQFMHIFAKNKRELRDQRTVKREKRLQLKISMAKAAIRELKRGNTPENKAITYLVIDSYIKLITMYRRAINEQSFKDFSRLEHELKDKAYQVERDEVQALYEKGQITMDVVREIRRQINMQEAYGMEGD